MIGGTVLAAVDTRACPRSGPRADLVRWLDARLDVRRTGGPSTWRRRAAGSALTAAEIAAQLATAQS